MRELKLNYQIDKNTRELGSGSFGKVFKTHNIKDPSLEVAIKVLDKKKLAETLDQVMEEITILNILDHPNICNHMETYDDSHSVYIGKCSKFTHSDGIHQRHATV